MKFIFLVLGTILFAGRLTGQEKLQVYIFLAEECPISIYMTGSLKKTAEELGSAVDFFAVFPNSRSNYKTMGVFVDEHELDQFQRILDEDQSVSKKLGATVTPEAVITNSSGQVLYRGGISDAFYKLGRRKHGNVSEYLRDALHKIQQGGSVSQPWPTAVGCYITFHKKDS